MITRTLIFLFGLTLTISGGLLAQNITLFSGQVLDASTKEPLTGANIFLKSNWRIGTSTDINGMFALEISQQQNDSLIISFVGYTEKIQPLSFRNTHLKILLIQKLSQMAEVVVTAEKLIAEEFNIQKIKRLEIYTNPSAKADALLAVNSLPSSTTVDESANVSFRGSNPNETGIFFNNVPVYDAVRFSQLNGIGTFSFFNTELLNNIQVFPGNPPLEFGNVTSGMVALQTDEQIKPQATQSVSVSLANLGIHTQQPIGKKSSLTGYINYQPSSFIKYFNRNSLESRKV